MLCSSCMVFFLVAFSFRDCLALRVRFVWLFFVYVIFTYLTGSLSCTYPLLTRCWLSFILFCLMLPCDGHTINYILRGVALFHLICYWRHIFFIYGVGLVQFVQNGSGLVCFLGF